MSHHHLHHEPAEAHPKTSGEGFLGWLNQNSSFFWAQFIALLGFIGVVLEIIVHFHDIVRDEDMREIIRSLILFIFILKLSSS